MVIGVGDKFVIKNEFCVQYNRQNLIGEVFIAKRFVEATSGEHYVVPIQNNHTAMLRREVAININCIEKVDNKLTPFSEDEIGVLLGI